MNDEQKLRAIIGDIECALLRFDNAHPIEERSVRERSLQTAQGAMQYANEVAERLPSDVQVGIGIRLLRRAVCSMMDEHNSGAY